MIKFILITNDPLLARYAENCGVDRIFVDLEQIGKRDRQGHLDTLISCHSMADVAKVKAQLTRAELLVRLNPLHDGTEREIDEAVTGGADFLVLPMFRSVEAVSEFCALVDGRTGVIPLVETLDAVESIEQMVRIQGVSEIYIGLNDLHLDMKLGFIFEPLAQGLVDKMAVAIKAAGLPFGFGGIARVGEGAIPGEMVLGEHFRLGSSSVILSRTFHRKSEGISDFLAKLDLRLEIEKLLFEGKALAERSSDEITEDHRIFLSKVADIA